MNKKAKVFVSAFLAVSMILPSYGMVTAKADEVTLVDNNFVFSQTKEKIPDESLSDAVYARYRRNFKGYKGRGTIIVENNGAKSAELYINGHKLDISDALKSSKASVKYDIGKYTVDGDNALKVTNISPEKASINVRVFYPELVYGNPEEVGFSSEKLKEVDDFINSEVKEGFPGAALIIVKDGKIIKNTAYGYKKKYEQDNLMDKFEEMSTDTLFDLASNSKMYSTNLALQKLVYEGKLDVNDKVCKYIPEFKDNSQDKIKGKDKIRVRDLLNHSAGFAPEVRYFDPESAGELYSQDRAATLKMLEKTPLVYETGTEVRYSDTDYMLLGYIVEKITGMPQDKYVEENIYKPLGLKSTVYNPLKKGFKKEDVAATERNGNTRDHMLSFPNIREYTLQGEVHDEKAWYSMDGVAGHAGLFSNTKDLAVLAQMILNEGGYGGVKLFDKNTLEKFTKPADHDDTYGLGWDRQGDMLKVWEFGPYASCRTIGHTGWTGTVSNIDPKNDMAVILLTNVRHTPCPNGNFEANSKFQTGRYGSIMSLVYEALLENHKTSVEKDSKPITEVISSEASQVDSKFPEDSPTSRIHARYRRVFKGYEGMGQIVVENHGATSAEVYINGKKIDISKALSKADGKAVLNIGAYTRDGSNAIKVLNVLPNKSYIDVKVLYPELIEGTPESVGLSKEKLDRIDEIINSEIKYGLPGAALLVVKDGKIVKDSYYGNIKSFDGQKKLENPKKIEKNSLFDLGNNTGLFSTNLAIQKLSRDGKINVDNAVSKYIPEFKGGGKENITLRNLLNHTSGLPIDMKFYDPNSGELYSVEREKTLANLSKVKLDFAPGAKVRYSDLDYMVLGYIVEKVTNMTQDEYVENNIYKPLGLKNTLYRPLDKGFEKDNIVATGIYGNTKNNTINYKGIRTETIQGEVQDENAFYSMGKVSGHSGLFSTARDLAVLSQVMLNRGGYGGVKLFDSDGMEQFTKSSELSRLYGLGLDRQSDSENIDKFGPYASSLTIGHTGDTGNAVLVDMKNDTAVILLTSLQHSDYNSHTKEFENSAYITSKYGNIMSMLYETLMEKGNSGDSSIIQGAKDQVKYAKENNEAYVARAAAASLDILVSKAEKSLNKKDLDIVKPLVNDLPDTKEKEALLSRIDLVEKKTNFEVDIKKAEEVLAKAEKSKDPVDVEQAEKLISNLLDGKEKKELMNRLEKLKKGIEEDKKEDKVSENKKSNEVEKAKESKNTIKHNIPKTGSNINFRNLMLLGSGFIVAGLIQVLYRKRR